MQITHLSDDMKKLMHDTEFLFKEFSQSANEKDPVKIYIGHCQVTLKRKMLEILKKSKILLTRRLDPILDTLTDTA